MADAPQPSIDTKETDKKMRERVDKLIGQATSESSGSIKLNGRSLEYIVNAAFLPVVAEGLDGTLGEPEAAVMATSYVLKGADARTRPVCFAFNGGPGSASIWLHIGALGPKHVVTPNDASMPTAPYAVADNPHSWFEHFDLVFIDPPHTGWSTTASLDARKKMTSVDGDVAALAGVVRTWLTRHKRWGSPVYLAGESYGTTRGAAMADKLQSAGVALSGLILISCAMDLQSIVFAPTNDLPYSLFLPAFANVSQYHGLLKGALAKSAAAARTAAEAFVDEEYVAALQAGARLDGKRRGRVARRIAEMTGLPQALV
jgi:carboxypeptidase C (cathepsin A)